MSKQELIKDYGSNGLYHLNSANKLVYSAFTVFAQVSNIPLGVLCLDVWGLGVISIIC